MASALPGVAATDPQARPSARQSKDKAQPVLSIKEGKRFGFDQYFVQPDNSIMTYCALSVRRLASVVLCACALMTGPVATGAQSAQQQHSAERQPRQGIGTMVGVLTLTCPAGRRLWEFRLNGVAVASRGRCEPGQTYRIADLPGNGRPALFHSDQSSDVYLKFDQAADGARAMAIRVSRTATPVLVDYSALNVDPTIRYLSDDIVDLQFDIPPADGTALRCAVQIDWIQGAILSTRVLAAQPGKADQSRCDVAAKAVEVDSVD